MANFFEKIFSKLKKDEDVQGTKPLKPSDMFADDATKPLEPVPDMITEIWSIDYHN